MRSWSTRRWRKGSARFSARCPPGPDAVCRYLLTPDPNPRDPMIQTTNVAHRTIKACDLDIFYREAGPRDAPAVLLLHGFPTSSQMFRNLIPALADRYRVLAPDCPGFGHSAMPPRDEFAYTFDNLAAVVEEFTAQLGLSKYALYVQDYGAPVGYRLASQYPDRVTAIVVQNGNAYDEGLDNDSGSRSRRTGRTRSNRGPGNAART